jgi:hypothetical protein
MEHVVAERVFDDPMTPDRLHALAGEDTWCLEQNRVKPVRTYLSGDGHKMVCLFEAPDAEAVRRVNQQAQVPAVRVWTASIHGPAADAWDGTSPLVLVERSFAEPVRFEELVTREEGGAWCLEANRVRPLRSYVSSNRQRMICLYAAPDAESVRRAQKQIGMPVDEVWSATVEWHG